MEDQKKVYGERSTSSLPCIYWQVSEGFTISLYEYEATIPTLWKTVKEFLKENPGLAPEDNALSFLSDDGGETYNRCHCMFHPPPFMCLAY